MLNRRSVHTILGLLFFMMVPIRGQDESRTSFGVGVSSSTYQTNWFYSDPYSFDIVQYHSPWHVHAQYQLVGFADRRLLTASSGMRLDLRLEAAVGIAGSTIEDWLPAGETISTGTSSIALNPMVRVGLPFALMDGRIRPYVGLGFAVTFLAANGEGADETRYASYESYNYDEGWSETLYSLFAPIGIAMAVGDGLLGIEYRLALGGDGETDWEPKGRAVGLGDGGTYYSALMVTYTMGRKP